jgi:predicted Holliday junction resolvase-like endonuclease
MEFKYIIGTILIISIIFTLILFTVYSEIDKYNIKKRNKALLDENSKILSQKKSSEVRLGKIGENMAPFFFDWPYDPNSFRFIGNPVDGISFNDNEVVFIEIKTGKSRLSNSQKKIMELVVSGKVKFVTFRVDENGSTLKEENC